MVATLKLTITASRFGRLLNNYSKRLEQKGIIITTNRTSSSRKYIAKFIEPLLSKRIRF